MDSNLVFAKTPTGDEAVRQSTRVVQRNLRMVLVQVDGKMTVEDLTAKIGNPRLVQSALKELEEGGFIAPTLEAVSMWEESMKVADKGGAQEPIPPMSQFSTFGPKSLGAFDATKGNSAATGLSSFGKPIFPSASGLGGEAVLPAIVAEVREPEHDQNQQGMSVGVSLFPSPSLKLSGVRIGEPVDGKIAELLVSSPFSLLGGAPHHIARIEVSGATFSANRVVALPVFMGVAAGNQEVIVRKVVIKRLQLALGESMSFNDLFGEIVFRQDGAIEKSTFESVDRSMLVNAQAGSQGLALSFEGRAWTPAGTPVSFASLQAKGVLQKNRLLVQNIDTTFLGGILRGNWLLDWSNGLVMAGDGTLSRLDARKVSAAFAPSLKIDGDMSGTLRLRSSGGDWGSLWGNVEAVLSTEITRGALHGVDLGEAVRRSGVSEVRAGSTKFDRLRSTINITPKQVLGRDVKMDAGMVTAAGQFNSPRNGEVEASMMVTMQTSVATQNASVRIYGVLPNLSATTRK